MKRGTPRHPKMYDLAATLKIPLPMAVGIMEMLWHHAGQHTPQGDIGSIPDEAIAEAVGWKKKPSILRDALLSSEWLETDNTYRLIVHDWPDHCEQSVRKWLQYNHKSFLPIYGVSPENLQPKDGNSPASREAKAVAMVEADVVSNSESTSPRAKLPVEEWFVEFWSLYWRKVDRANAFKAFKKYATDEETKTRIIDAVRAQTSQYAARESDKRPHAATWLNGRRYEDDPEVYQPAMSKLDRIMETL